MLLNTDNSYKQKWKKEIVIQNIIRLPYNNVTFKGTLEELKVISQYMLGWKMQLLTLIKTDNEDLV